MSSLGSHPNPWVDCWDAQQENPFVLAFSPYWGWLLGGRGGILLRAKGEGLAKGTQILAEAVRWSGFSCNCRGDFPVVFQL